MGDVLNSCRYAICRVLAGDKVHNRVCVPGFISTLLVCCDWVYNSFFETSGEPAH